jgi:hypothetical protein
MAWTSFPAGTAASIVLRKRMNFAALDELGYLPFAQAPVVESHLVV